MKEKLFISEGNIRNSKWNFEIWWKPFFERRLILYHIQFKVMVFKHFILRSLFWITFHILESTQIDFLRSRQRQSARVEVTKMCSLLWRHIWLCRLRSPCPSPKKPSSITYWRKLPASVTRVVPESITRDVN